MPTHSKSNPVQDDPKDPGGLQLTKEHSRRDREDFYRGKWRWDTVGTAAHCVDCYPSNCPYRAYVKDGVVWYSEARGDFGGVEQGVPDMNPMGCQKGVAWQDVLYGKQRLLYPLKRVGKRGSGKWRRISWDQALGELADALLDAIQEGGPQSIISLSGGSPGGLQAGGWPGIPGPLMTDHNSEVNDFAPGHYITWGKFDPVSSVDDWFHAELTIVWFANYAYTRIPYFHFALEARYKGAELIVIAPDTSATTVHADYHVPVKIGTDAALCLGMCKVIVDEGIYNATFVKEQTDLPLLVRRDNRQFLRESDLKEDGREDQFYFYDAKTRKMVAAPRGTLALGKIDPALERSYRATLKDGSTVEVVPAFALLKERLKDYTPEKASVVCGVHPDVIRTLARKTATKRTNILSGEGNAGKYYHGDLIERAMLLMLALTGNWGRKGTGVRCWTTVGLGSMPPEAASQLLAPLKAEDPTMSDEIATIELQKRTAAQGGGFVSPIFVWYYHAGYGERWNRREYNDPSMKRSFDEYFNEAVEKGWWKGVDLPKPEMTPRVLLLDGSNPIRRTPGGQTQFLRHLWPKLKMIATLEVRMSASAMYSDILLPVAAHYEKQGFCFPTTHVAGIVFGDKVADPPGEAKAEWEIKGMMAQKLEKKAKERGIAEYTDAFGRTHSLEGLYNAHTAGGAWTSHADLIDVAIGATSRAGALPEGTNLETMREKGYIRWTNLGTGARALGQGTEIQPDETFSPFRHHTEKKAPYPTLTRRAQFYIDHHWFLEAGEELPVHKDNPKMGGDYPFTVTSGHGRWSIHALNISHELMLSTHRGRPHIVMNPDDAARKGMHDNEEVRVHNDLGSILVRVMLSQSVRPGQIIIYNGWEPYQFRGGQGTNTLEAGMVKWLRLAGGYGHLQYWPFEWSPVPTMRGSRVEVAKIDSRRRRRRAQG
jgi:DMSO reductase family type II enzyme molybdopterin subunit